MELTESTYCFVSPLYSFALRNESREMKILHVVTIEISDWREYDRTESDECNCTGIRWRKMLFISVVLHFPSRGCTLSRYDAQCSETGYLWTSWRGGLNFGRIAAGSLLNWSSFVFRGVCRGRFSIRLIVKLMAGLPNSTSLSAMKQGISILQRLDSRIVGSH